MPDREPRDREGRTFSEFVADQVMAAIIASGKSLRQVAADAGINRTTLRDRIHDKRPFNTRELVLIAQALERHPAEFMTGWRS